MKNKSKILMTHLVAGFPTEEKSLELAKELVEAGAGMLEIQIPFSDPIADGPMIVGACHSSLANGFTARDIFEFVRKASGLGVPIAVMTYGNVPHKIGLEAFVRKIRDAGATSLIVPDFPFDSNESIQLQHICKENLIDLIQVISPGMEQKRLIRVLRCAQGFIYCTTQKGTTGNALHKREGLNDFLKRVRRGTDVPIALGFGIAKPQDIRKLKKQADILVVGTTIIKTITPVFDSRAAHRLVSSLVQAF